MTERRELSPDELSDYLQNGANASMADVQVSGIVTIKDKDGNVKAELPIVSLEATQESENNAT